MSGLKAITVKLTNVTIELDMLVNDPEPSKIVTRLEEILKRAIWAGEKEASFPRGSVDIQKIEVPVSNVEVNLKKRY